MCTCTFAYICTHEHTHTSNGKSPRKKRISLWERDQILFPNDLPCGASLLDAVCDWTLRTIYTSQFLCPHLPLVRTEWSRNFTQSRRGVLALKGPSMNNRISMLLMASLFICSNSLMGPFKKHLDFTLSSLVLLCLKNSKYWKKLFSEHSFLAAHPSSQRSTYYYLHLLLQMRKNDVQWEHPESQYKLLIRPLTSRLYYPGTPGIQTNPCSTDLQLN